ncbi:hypothetical protein EUTSA_v10023790mg [Eutrema salsugineum]|uniref:Uncharacterized protein n=1 Tax=Eutrema salsugineum TaxID=72664 RepID=V4MET9_EUTSA|nr:hypothetical protein EUTSA_v10023790mg [Eutrema salsugineum]
MIWAYFVKISSGSRLSPITKEEVVDKTESTLQGITSATYCYKRNKDFEAKPEHKRRSQRAVSTQLRYRGRESN